MKGVDDPVTTPEDIRQSLELDLVLGRLSPRERLVEDELISRFNAKRHVIRSVLTDLERTGLVERRPNKGAYVRDYAPDEVEELYDLRASLHSLAVDRFDLPPSPAVIATLNNIAASHEDAVLRDDLADVIRFNNDFHDVFFDLCGNRFLSEQIRNLASAANAIRSYRIGDPELLKQAMREHREMIDALAAGKIDMLRSLVKKHIVPSKELYLRDTRAFRPV
jgi:DNA-binding GntR family transcriptional regulator